MDYGLHTARRETAATSPEVLPNRHRGLRLILIFTAHVMGLAERRVVPR